MSGVVCSLFDKRLIDFLVKFAREEEEVCERRCYSCHTLLPPASAFRCTECKSAAYCDLMCQQAHSSVHRQSCDLRKKMSIRTRAGERRGHGRDHATAIE